MCDKKCDTVAALTYSEDEAFCCTDLVCNHTIDDNISLTLSIEPSFGVLHYEREVHILLYIFGVKKSEYRNALLKTSYVHFRIVVMTTKIMTTTTSLQSHNDSQRISGRAIFMMR